MVPQVGERAPQLELENQDGKTVRLADLAGRKVVVYFYPRDSTPGCTTEACDFRDRFERLQARGVVVLGVSKDSAKSHQRFREKQSLPFDLLCDVAGEACQGWGVWQLKKAMGREAMGIVRSTFLVGEDGCIERVWSPVAVRGHVDAVLEALES